MAPHFARQGIALREEEQRQRAEYRLDAASLLVVDGEPVGLLKVLREGDDWTLEQFQLAPSHQGRGLGTRVLRALIADARASGADLRLSVLKQNPAARLHERAGFRTLGETAGRMDFGHELPALSPGDDGQGAVVRRRHVLGFRPFGMRGLHRVSAEWKLVCMALNLRRMARLTGS